jgi:hypothetical protein
MKQKDISLIFLVAGVSVIVALIISKEVFSAPKNRTFSVQQVQPIASTFDTPDVTYFSSKQGNYDPTQYITIGPNNNTNPFPEIATQ